MTLFTLLALVRWIQFTSAVILFGAAAFPFYALEGGSHDSSRCGLTEDIWRMIGMAGLVASLSGIAWLFLSLLDMSGSIGDLAMPGIWAAFLFETSFGPAWLIRLVVYAGIMLVVVRRRSSPRFAAMTVLGAILLMSQAWLGHAAQSSGPMAVIAISAYAAHLLGAGAWLGGLAPLVLALREARRTRFGAGATGSAGLLGRFSQMGYGFVTIIAVSAVINVWLRLAGISGPISVDYERLLIVKAILFAAMIVLAGINRFGLTEQLEGGQNDPERVIKLLLISIAVEFMIGLAILLAAAFLGTTDPSAAVS